jgi:hypothetical protein
MSSQMIFKKLHAKKISEFPNYFIFNDGKIYSKKRIITQKNGKLKNIGGCFLKHLKGKKGYLYVNIINKFGQKHKFIHRLIGEAFIPNPENKPEINHKHPDGNVTRNTLENLEWATSSENRKHSYRVLKRKHPMIGTLGIKNVKSKKTVQLKDGRIIKTWDSQADAGRSGFSQKSISACCLGNISHHKGFQWEYVK